jgi:DNA-directed RNA polymerase specialized sigma24 family protein
MVRHITDCSPALVLFVWILTMFESITCDSNEQTELRLISTHLSALSSPSRFVLRYGAAVRAYLQALLPTQDDADEVEQEFLLRVVEKGIPVGDRSDGRYRHYLIATVRNSAFRYLRNLSRRPALTGDLTFVSADSSAELQWHRYWRDCVLQCTWQALRDHEARNPGNLFHTVLKAFVEYPEDDSNELAERVSAASGQRLSAEAFRKQLSRARHKFAQLLVAEVSRTIAHATPERVAEELQELDLMKYVRTILPDLANM